MRCVSGSIQRCFKYRERKLLPISSLTVGMAQVRWNVRLFGVISAFILVAVIFTFLRVFGHNAVKKLAEATTIQRRIRFPENVDNSKQLYLSHVYKKKFCPYLDNCTLTKPFVDYVSRQMLAPKFGISACVIYKNFSTVFTAIICYLYNSLDYKKHIKHMMDDTYNGRYCEHKNEFLSFGIHDRIKPKNASLKYSHYLLVREPKERFLSGFINKCIVQVDNRPNACYDCKQDMLCFFERLNEHLNLVANGLQKPARNVEESHFMPQSWSCELGQHLEDYKIFKFSPKHTEEMLAEILDEFEAQGVSKTDTDYIKSQVLSGNKTFHATYDSPERLRLSALIDNSIELKQWLIRLYYYDYLLFNYPFPEL